LLDLHEGGGIGMEAALLKIGQVRAIADSIRASSPRAKALSVQRILESLLAPIEVHDPKLLREHASVLMSAKALEVLIRRDFIPVKRKW
jgi:hypothetical protein